MPHLTARADAKLALPEGFIPVTAQVPPHSRPVLAIRIAQSTQTKFEVLTARYNPEYENSQWRDLSGDSVRDSGMMILGWRECPEWLVAR